MERVVQSRYKEFAFIVFYELVFTMQLVVNAIMILEVRDVLNIIILKRCQE